MTRIEALKKATGVKKANCVTCRHVIDASEPWYPAAECGKNCDSSDKNFPYEDEQDCWEPDLWVTKFAPEEEDGLPDAYTKFEVAVDGVNARYQDRQTGCGSWFFGGDS